MIRKLSKKKASEFNKQALWLSKSQMETVDTAFRQIGIAKSRIKNLDTRINNVASELEAIEKSIRHKPEIRSKKEYDKHMHLQGAYGEFMAQKQRLTDEIADQNKTIYKMLKIKMGSPHGKFSLK